MLKKLTAPLGIILLASSFAFAGQSASQPANPSKAVPQNGTTSQTPPTTQAQPKQSTAHSKQHAAKKHHKQHKKQASTKK